MASEFSAGNVSMRGRSPDHAHRDVISGTELAGMAVRSADEVDDGKFGAATGTNKPRFRTLLAHGTSVQRSS